MKKIKILSWIPIVGTFYVYDALYYAIFTKKVYIFCRLYHFITLFVIGYFIGKIF
jgi:hypothetical protein